VLIIMPILGILTVYDSLDEMLERDY
jgi:hypothetical protein